MWWIFGALAMAQDPAAGDDPTADAAEPAPTDEAAGDVDGPDDEGADEPPDEDAPDEVADEDVVDEEVDAEMTVYGRLAIDRAEDAIVDRMEALGYRADRQGDRIVFKPPLGWMGAAILEDGEIRFRRPVTGIAGPDDSVNMELFRRMDPDTPATEGYGLRFWLFPSMKKIEPIRAELIEAIGPELANYNAVVARTALQERLAGLPKRLDAVWRAGSPLVGTETLETPTERRRHVLEYWATRTSTPEGRLTARAVADWLEAVVQESDHPILESERTEFEGRRADGLTLPR